MAFVYKCAVVHLGDVTPHETEDVPAFLCSTEHKGGSQSTPTDTIQLVFLAKTDTQSVPNGAKNLEVLKSTLFHRWLLGLTGLPKEHGFEYVEHRNSLGTSTTLHGHIIHMNRLKRAFWVEGVGGAARKAEETNGSQEPYWNSVRLLPPPPDFVFAFKRVKRLQDLPRKLETLQPAGCSSTEQ